MTPGSEALPNVGLAREMPPPKVERFEAIEGLRALLAWGVFVGHIALFAGLSRVGLPERAGEIASSCVEVFIILSGFVITHLLLSRDENYRQYIAKRFFRLFPAYILCASLGSAAIAISQTPWPHDPAYQYGQQLIALQASQAQHFVAHVLLHLTMFHGVVPNNVLNVSQWALLPTAWSISLEWQFYLVAPALLLLFRRRGGGVLVAVLTVVGLWLYARGFLGVFESPSVLPGAAELFLLGIASRLCWGEVKPAAPAVIATGALVVGYFAEQMAIALWIAFASYLFCDRRKLRHIDRRFIGLADALFAGRFPKWAGKRTYSVYLVHYPIFQLLLTALTLYGAKSPTQVGALLLIFGLPLTIITAEAVHRYVEIPGIRIGKDVARLLGAASTSVTAAHQFATRRA